VAATVGIAASAFSTAALPYLSRMVAQNDWNACRHTLKRYLVGVAATTVPFALLLAAFSKPLVKLLFQRGAFTGADTAVVSWVQVCYSIQIPFYVGSVLFVRFLSSIRRNDVLMYISGINLVLDVVLNLVLMRRWGVAGLALSTSLVYVISFLCVAGSSAKLLARQSRLAAGKQSTTHPETVPCP
jgi:putative peptidoglycan lipid II flippase